jgi:glucosylceramidase
MGADTMRTMLESYWLPMFAAAKLTTKILLLDFNHDHVSLVTPFLGDTKIQNSPYVAGIAFHGYGGDPSIQTTVYDQYGCNIYFTEWSGFTDGRAQQEADMRKMVSVIRNYGKTFVKWPVATDEEFGPHIGGCSGCRGLVRVWRYEPQKAGTFDYRIDYYDIGHITKFVANGAWRVFSTYSSQILNVAFVNPDKSVALLVFNDTLADKQIKVVWAGQAFSYTVPSKASITFAWSPSVAVQPFVSSRDLERLVSLTHVSGGFSVVIPPAHGFSVELLNIRGRLLARKCIAGTEAFLDTRGIPPGTYLIRAICGEAHWQRRVLVAD